MALVHPDATIEPSKLDLVSGWISDQRWYTSRGRTPQLRRLSSFRFDDPEGEVGVETLIVADESGTVPVVYQVPLTYRAAPLAGAQAALIGTAEHSVLGTRYVYDGCHDPVYAAELLRTIVAADVEAKRSDGAVSATVRGSGVVGRQTPRHGTTEPMSLSLARSRVLSGEQSNTSIIGDVELDGTAQQLICKVFRVLHEGSNPDVEVQAVLSAAGSTQVPAMLGSLSGTWRDEERQGPPRDGDLAFAQEFLPGVRDAWREAVAAATDDTDFTERARALGQATAAIHTQLARSLPTVPGNSRRVTAITSGMRLRFAQAAAVRPSLAGRRASVEETMERLDGLSWPALQRIHGDYHLGQVLDVPGRGWIVLDFEGEPLRPLHERVQPDCVLRDVAGMLRSFDYAAGSVQQGGGPDRTAWAHAARSAFLEGYSAGSGLNLVALQPLLDAFEVDKALYELVYETRHRPDWVGIPASAIDRLLPEDGTLPDGHPAGDDPGDPNGLSPDQHAPTDRTPRPPRRSTTVSPARPASSRMPWPQRLDPSDAAALVAGTHRGPHGVLGGHPGRDGVTVRVLRPLAASVAIRLPDGTQTDLTHEHEGIWTALIPGEAVPEYSVVTTYEDGVEHVADDPYRYLPTLGEIDIHLIGEGRHEQLWTVLGAHVRSYEADAGPVRGTSFAVWAPNARAVRVIGDFNRWSGLGHQMRVLGTSGIWEIFVPGVDAGTHYKFEILGPDGAWRQKADPMARLAQTAPKTASLVTESAYEWGDEGWLRERAEHSATNSPMSVYEVHLTSWRQGQSYRDLAEHLVNYVKDLGFTHVELMPVMDHPYPPSWGYHVTSYYAPNSRLGDPDDFKYLVDTLHQNGIGVILDWVPGHFATDEWALARFDGTPLYEHPDPRRGWHPEWGSYIFDFGRPQVRNFLVANAIYWLEEFHADGLRVDGVASMLYLDYSRNPGEWVPNRDGGRENLEAVQLLQETNATAYKRVPGIVTIAEESTSWPGVSAPTAQGGLGFGFKWNMGWMHDSLDYLAKSPVYRQYHHNKLTFGLTYAWSEHFVLPISHDEVVHGKGSLLRKMPGNRWEQLANLRAYLAYMWAHPGKQLLFMGCEFAQESEWADGRSLDWWLLDQPAHWGVHALTKDLNRVYREHAALWEQDHQPGGFQWIQADDAARNTFSFLRRTRDDERAVVAVVVNFSGSEHTAMQVGLPFAGAWREVLNTDAASYGGSGVGNLGVVEATDDPADGQPASARVTVGPLSAVWLVPDDPDTQVDSARSAGRVDRSASGGRIETPAAADAESPRTAPGFDSDSASASPGSTGGTNASTGGTNASTGGMNGSTGGMSEITEEKR
ncbi:1,4-alpha-glucan branching protein GlgB [Luteipulveratus flavus]|uniref:1,4-alpha-glucan branching enzyme GlgB n=1 Tax=Luteipulveratus flavus TaxID=3031728 RepID=A0ABT6C7U2_9MICO|nr:1,4-alpha-glucan branching protein GlgB [Luteipulveratus sp. YIM 133296]MDF8264938.1 1,4-alpha-glucan branching protein GlgB [Luteipulveratus sp. YIM 133296]